MVIVLGGFILGFIHAGNGGAVTVLGNRPQCIGQFTMQVGELSCILRKSKKVEKEYGGCGSQCWFWFCSRLLPVQLL